MIYNFKVSEYTSANGWTTQDFTDYVVGNNPFVGFSEVDSRITGQLNEGYIEFINNNTDNLPMFAIVTIEKVDNSTTPATTKTTSYYIGSDKTEIVDKENNLVLHRVELVDLTKKLEKYTLETKTFTQTYNYESYLTIELALKLLLACAKLQRDANYEVDDWANVPNDLGITISNSLIFATSDIEVPQTVLSNLTLREAINELLKSINSICYLDFDVNNHILYLKHECYNNLKNVLSNSIKIDSKNQEHSVDDYSSELDNFVKNQITESIENGITTFYPSESALGYVRTSNNDYELTDNNFGILLPNNIYTLKELDLACRFKMETEDLDEQTTIVVYQNQQALLNATRYVFEKEQYQTLPTDPLTVLGDATNTSLYYEYGNNFIPMGNTFKGLIFQKYSWKTVIVKAFLDRVRNDIDNWYFPSNVSIVTHTYDIFIYDYIDNSPICSATLTIYRDTSTGKRSISSLSVSDDLAATSDKIKYRVSYIPIYNTRVKTQKDDISEVKKITSNFSNQRAKIISLQNIGLADKSQLERIGNQNYSITIRHKSLNGIYQNGDYTNEGYIITKSEYIYYDDYIIGKYDLTKNYQKLSEYIGINSEYRPFEIPSGKNVYERNCMFNSFAYVSTSHTPIYTQNTIFGNNAISCFADTITGNYSNNIHINGAVIDIDNLSTKWNSLVSGKNRLYLNCQSDGSANNVLFTFNFLDNISAGYFIKTDNLGKKLMQKIPYTYSGYFDKMNINFVNSFVDFDMKDQPLVSANNNYNVASLNDLLILKDPSEIIQFTFELSFINTDLERIRLGKDFAKLNKLVYKDTSKRYFLYGSNTKFGYDLKTSSAIALVQLSTSNVLSTVYNNTYNEIQFSNDIVNAYNYNYYAIGNYSENEFLITFDRDTFENGIGISFSDERIDIEKTF